MNTHSADKKQQFAGWLPDVVGKVPGMEQITYAGVTEVTAGDVLRVIYTNGHIKNANGIDTQQFRVAVSNTGNMQEHEMWAQFKQQVGIRLADAITTNQSLPSA